MTAPLEYTVNDATQITCPHCHETFEFSDDLTGVTEYNLNCHVCESPLEFEIKTEVIVIAWKRGARR